MATLKDIARSIANNENMKGRDADAFVTAIVETILEGLERDRQVKIKGFGTFKLTAVRDRESINVNTGERVVISGHDKITFTPNDEVRDIINRPFAQFETVIVSDKVDVNALIAVDETPVESEMPIVVETEKPEEIKAKETQEAKPEEVVETKVEETVVAETDDTVAAEPEETQETKIEEANAAEAEEQVEVDNEPKVEPAMEEPETKEVSAVEKETDTDIIQIIEEEDIEESEDNSSYTLLLCIIVGIICFIAGYFCREYDVLSMIMPKQTPVAEQPVDTTKAVKDTVTVAPVVQNNDTIATPEQPVVEEKKAEEVIAEEKKVKPNGEEELNPRDFFWDSRVRTGAYYIIGVKETVKVKKGETLQSISKTHLGSGMECYMEALNNNREVKEGDIVKIPKLRLKKIKKFR